MGQRTCSGRARLAAERKALGWPRAPALRALSGSRGSCPAAGSGFRDPPAALARSVPRGASSGLRVCAEARRAGNPGTCRAAHVIRAPAPPRPRGSGCTRRPGHVLRCGGSFCLPAMLPAYKPRGRQSACPSFLNLQGEQAHPQSLPYRWGQG